VETRSGVGSFHDAAVLWPTESERDPTEETTMRLRLFALLAATAILVAAAAVFTLAREDEAAVNAASVSEHPVAIPASARTVAVSPQMPMPSAHERRLSAMLEHGTMPDRPMMAEVMTDTDCTPDAEMISRCRNVVRLADGRQIVLRHPHDMTSIPCLAPGERVQLIPNGV
jgi:hypothetical protein